MTAQRIYARILVLPLFLLILFPVSIAAGQATTGSPSETASDPPARYDTGSLVNHLFDVQNASLQSRFRVEADGSILMADDANIINVDQIIGFNDIRFSGSDGNRTDLMILGNGRIGVGQTFSNVTFNVRGIDGNRIINAVASDGTNVLGVDDNQITFNRTFVQNGRVGINQLSGNVTFRVRGQSGDHFPFWVADTDGSPGFIVQNGGVVGVRQAITGVSLNVLAETSHGLVLRAADPNGTSIFEVQPDKEVFVIGDFFVNNGSKNFQIDHPLDPANKSLRHNAVESPGYVTYYHGNVVLGAGGEAWVDLPDYFEALNKDFTYQFTPIGGAAPGLYVAEEVSGNRFRVAGGTPGLKVSWQVTATRNDPYAQRHPYEAVVEKEGVERGRFFYPQGYGQPAARAIGYQPAEEAKRVELQEVEQQPFVPQEPEPVGPGSGQE